MQISPQCSVIVRNTVAQTRQLRDQNMIHMPQPTSAHVTRALQFKQGLDNMCTMLWLVAEINPRAGTT
jgi:hypothetical protein